MSDEQIIKLIEEEFSIKSLGVTQQYLEIHHPVYVDQLLSVARIDREATNGVVIAYLPVQGENFYFAVYINAMTAEITGIGTEGQHRVYFHASSESLSDSELCNMCSLIPTESQNKGALKKNGRAKYGYSAISYLPNPEPDEFEDKLRKLLDFLEQDEIGIKRLVNEAAGYIQVAMEMHNGNGMLLGPTIDKSAIQRMAGLGLEINFDLYVSGNQFLEAPE